MLAMTLSHSKSGSLLVYPLQQFVRVSENLALNGFEFGTLHVFFVMECTETGPVQIGHGVDLPQRLVVGDLALHPCCCCLSLLLPHALLLDQPLGPFWLARLALCFRGSAATEIPRQALLPLEQRAATFVSRCGTSEA